ncbi:S8 family serine peptidase [Sphingobium sp. AN558]|uniref:S8 family serine peptidase n=1 Tax=Sphingobium sp. AN558 TaxID=3133442 RepID=UPI0030C0C0DA
MKIARNLIIASLGLATPCAHAQLLPSSRGTLGQMDAILPDALARAADVLERAPIDGQSPALFEDSLLAARAARVTGLLRRHGDIVELDDKREPARRGEILLTGADAFSLEALRKAGYGVSSETIEGLGIAIARLTVPDGVDLSQALRRVRKLAPLAVASADNLYFPSGMAIDSEGMLATSTSVNGRAIGMIDGGVASHPALSGPIGQRGFAQGAPRPSTHGTAVASLISGLRIVRGAAPGAPLLAADVYGTDPAGGGAFAIARALGWMVASKVTVVTISLVGPDNPLLAGAIRFARDRGITVVAAVGNDGPAAPPAYPASYPGVIAVTGIDDEGRLLPEAGHTLHVDFAAPGADMDAAQPDGGKGRVRGTSFAAPLVAGRLFAAGSLTALRKEAIPAPRGRGRAYGYGIVCGKCRNID